MSEQDDDRLNETVLSIIKDEDSLAAIDYLERQPNDPLTIVNQYHLLVKHCYYEAKDIQAMIMMALAGAKYGLAVARAREENDPLGANELRLAARGILYNLASYLWPGWDEPGIEIAPGYLAQGLDAAKATLRLAKELEMPPIRVSRSHWLLGAQLLASGNLSDAQEQFELAVDKASEAAQPAEVLLAEGYKLITIQLGPTEQVQAQSRYQQIRGELAGLEDGDFFVAQLDTAYKVFSS